jgi:uncharacterized damage-inducible protein DinB
MMPTDEIPEDEILPEYSLAGAVRGKYAERHPRDPGVIIHPHRPPAGRADPSHATHTRPNPAMTDSSNDSSIARIAFSDLEPELATTRRVLERLPDEHFDWKPHPKSFSFGTLATHVANLVHWQVMALTLDELDLGAQAPQVRPTDRDGVLRAFDANVEELRATMAGMQDAAFSETWTLRMGERVIMQMPRLGVMRMMSLNHMIHHRAQLGVYLRLLDLPVPPVYGPTADEQAAF